MKATLTTLAVVLAGALAAAAGQATQTSQPPVPLRQTTPDVVLTGCIVQGSSSTVFIFDRAKKEPNSAVEKGLRYLLTSVVEDIDLRTHLNHEVRITGVMDLRVSAMPEREPVAGDLKGPANERTLPRLVARSITKVSDTCPAGTNGQ
ncbi:MAG TPA: hypothetical protein VMZ90_07200 [Vicinamibacterales bacterium]|nr:hypothetical protein [Vicinamibacterales bacterium]